MNDYEDATFDDGLGVEPSTSKLAVAALVCSIVCCQPITTILGMLLGGVALVRIGMNPALKGRGIALAAVLLGVVFTGMHAYALKVLTSPHRAIQAAIDNDPEKFRSFFHGDGATATNAEIALFATQIEGRYGEYVWAQPVQPSDSARSAGGQMAWDYEFSFADATMPGVVQLTLTGKLYSIKITDEAQGDLKIPVAGSPLAPTAPGAARPPSRPRPGGDTDHGSLRGSQDDGDG